MKVEIELEDYKKENGLQMKWENGFCIEVKADEGEVLVSANRAGLISLANHLLTLAQEGVPEGSHIHLDEYNSLEENSAELVIEKIL